MPALSDLKMKEKCMVSPGRITPVGTKSTYWEGQRTTFSGRTPDFVHRIDIPNIFPHHKK